MNLLFRFFWLLIISRFRTRISVLDPCRTPFRCWPSDLDILRHMNNGKYFSIMDLARVDLMNRAQIADKIASAGFYPVVVGESMRFRRSLKVFQKFEVETRVLGWDEIAFFLEQRFIVGAVVHAEAVVRARFLKKSGGSALPSEVLHFAGHHHPSPDLPDWVKAWSAHQVTESQS